jgi:hypothetical protein
MNFFQVVFVAFCIFQLWCSLSKLHETPKFFGIVYAVIWLLAITFLLNPTMSTEVANLFGVGRGADLILYLLVFLSLWGHYQYYLRYRKIEIHITTLVRQLALQEHTLGANE